MIASGTDLQSGKEYGIKKRSADLTYSAAGSWYQFSRYQDRSFLISSFRNTFSCGPVKRECLTGWDIFSVYTFRCQTDVIASIRIQGKRSGIAGQYMIYPGGLFRIKESPIFIQYRQFYILTASREISPTSIPESFSRSICR